MPVDLLLDFYNDDRSVRTARLLYKCQSVLSINMCRRRLLRSLSATIACVHALGSKRCRNS